jgi:hypothetical protein
MKNLIIVLLLVSTLPGCIPLVVGGYIGYKMAEKDAHVEWCSTHTADESCHP